MATALRYTTDAQPGLSRERRPSGFIYRDPRGRRVRNPGVLQRIRSLAVPPAWEKVWICGDENGHLQVTGRDARGRKQYRYHAAWRAARESHKFAHLKRFGAALPAIRRRVDEDMSRPGLAREKVLAMIVRLLDLTGIRVGNERYADENDSFGLTTLRNRHVQVAGPRIEFSFRGKSGKAHRVRLEDPRLSRLIRRCRELPGQELFQYVDDAGEARTIDSGDVNEYLRAIAGLDITTKDFRTWIGSVCVARELAGCERCSAAEVNEAIRRAAQVLGNTPAICRKSYVHPRVADAATWQRRVRRPRVVDGLRADEQLLLQILSRRVRLPRSKPASTRSHPGVGQGPFDGSRSAPGRRCPALPKNGNVRSV